MSEKCAGRRSAVANTQEIYSLSQRRTKREKVFFFRLEEFFSRRSAAQLQHVLLSCATCNFPGPVVSFSFYVRLRTRALEIDKTVNLFGFSQKSRSPRRFIVARYTSSFFFETSEENFSLFSFPPSTSRTTARR